MRPKHCSKLLDNWDAFVRKTLNLASRDVKDKVARVLLSDGLALLKNPQDQGMSVSYNPNLLYCCSAKKGSNSNLYYCLDKLAYIILQLLPYIRTNHFYMEKGNQVKARVDELQHSYLVVVQVILLV